MITDYTTQMYGIFYTILDHDHRLYSLDVKLHLSKYKKDSAAFLDLLGNLF